jgi:hypothetical protein
MVRLIIRLLVNHIDNPAIPPMFYLFTTVLNAYNIMIDYMIIYIKLESLKGNY